MKKVKILGVSWSPKHGNTDILVQEALAAAVQGYPNPVSTLDPEGPSAVKQDPVGMYSAKCVGWRVVETTKAMKYDWDQMEKDEGKWPPYSAEYLITSDK